MWLNTIIPGVGLGYTLSHQKPDHATLTACQRTASRIEYPKPDGVLTFDRLTDCPSRPPITRKTSRRI